MAHVLLLLPLVTANPIWWKKERSWNPFSTERFQFFDARTGRITDPDEISALEDLLRNNPGARKRGLGAAVSRRADVWVDASLGIEKMAVTNGRAGMILPLPGPGKVNEALKTIRSEWLCFDEAHRVGALRLSEAQANQLQEVLGYVARQANRGARGVLATAAVVAVVAGGALGGALLARAKSRSQSRAPRPEPLSPLRPSGLAQAPAPAPAPASAPASASAQPRPPSQAPPELQPPLQAPQDAMASPAYVYPNSYGYPYAPSVPFMGPMGWVPPF